MARTRTLDRILNLRLPAGATSILDEAVGAWKANTFDSVNSRLTDLTGRGHHAAFPGGVNNPTRLDYAGQQFCYLPGIASNYISTPDSAAVSITGDIDLRVKVALDVWTPAAIQVLVAKWSATPSAYLFRVDSDGSMGFFADPNLGGGSFSNTLGLTNGSVKWLRVTYQLNNGSGSKVITFYTSDDGVTWTVNKTNTIGGVATLTDSTDVLALGAQSNGTTQPLAGKLYYAEIRNGINGTVVATFDASLLTEPFAYYSPVANLLDKDSSDLEGSIGRWNIGVNSTRARSTLFAAEGTASLEITSVAAGDSSASSNGSVNRPSVVPGAQYTARAEFRTAVSARLCRLDIGWYDASDVYISSSFGTYITDTTSGFTVAFVTATAPANAAWCDPSLIIVANGAAAEKHYVDRIAFNAGTSTAWVAGGVPWKMNRSATGKKLAVVDRTMLLFGTDDLLDIADDDDLDFALTDSFTIVAAVRRYGSAAGLVLIGKQAGVTSTTLGWQLRSKAAAGTLYSFSVGDGTAGAAADTGAWTVGTAQLAAGVRNTSADTLTGYVNAALGTPVTDTTTATSANANVVRIGGATDSTAFIDMELIGLAVFRRALTTSELAQVAREFGVAA